MPSRTASNGTGTSRLETRQDGVFGLVNYMAGFTGRATWAPADYDNDGCPDHMDSNNRRYGCS